MIRLADVASGRDNNLNLIRMIAASAVLVSHAFPIDRGIGAYEPLLLLTGHSLGTLSVYVFFLISGFLIAASFEKSANVPRFIIARVLRLVPGLAVSVILVAFVLGPSVTTVPVRSYFSDAHTWRFVPANIVMLFPQFTLPGVFTTNPYPTVEGSIWTLIHEVACYGLVLIAGLCGLLNPRMAPLLIGLYALGWSVTLLYPAWLPLRLLTFQELSFPFFLGMCGWIFRASVKLSFLGVIILFAAWLVTRNTQWAFVGLIICLGYSIAWVGYVPGGHLRAYNRFGDYSYGMYIYAFPLQGLIVWIFGSVGPLLHVALAFPVTLVAAILSWHLIEKPALGFLRRSRRTAQ